jgi:hypothetical protein
MLMQFTCNNNWPTRDHNEYLTHHFFGKVLFKKNAREN